jgi:enhancer of mRNA-decapping protein 4
LTQLVLLSLIQQLSSNFDTDIELKHRYLEEAVLHLDPSDPLTHQVAVTILCSLHSMLTTYIQLHDPNDTMYHPIEKLLTICDISLRGYAQ